MHFFKHTFVLFALMISMSSADAAQDPSVLFIGNSYTFENNAAGQLEALARANGYNIEVHLDAAPGAGIARAFADEEVVEDIRQGRFTHIILQPGGMSDNGQWRLDGRGIAATSLPPLAERLARYSDLAAQGGAEIWVVETWPNSRGTEGDRDNLRARLVEAIEASNSDINLLPVGRAVWHARQAGVENLYKEDGHHPGSSTATIYAQLALQAISGERARRPDNGSVRAAQITFQRSERGWNLVSGDEVEVARYDSLDWAALVSATQTAWQTRTDSSTPVQPDWPNLPFTAGTIEASDLLGYWEGETRHFPREWPWPAQMTLNFCETEQGIRVELTYLFRDENGHILRRDHLHLDAQLEDSQLLITREGALFGGTETLRAVVNNDTLTGTAALIDPTSNLRVEGRWSAQRTGPSWTCSGDR